MPKKRILSRSQRAEMWLRWKRGESLRTIAAALGSHSGSIHGMLKLQGGIEPRERCRSVRQLTVAEREEISRGLVAGLSLRELGRRLSRSASTISREVARNGGRREYRATAAEKAAWNRAKRPKRCRLASNRALRQVVASKLRHQWSPWQIAGWLRRTYDNDPSMQVSHETIYRSLFVQARGALRQELTIHLRSRRQMRRTLEVVPHQRGQIVDAISIRERPAEIEDRALPGHWEGDLIVGANCTYVATLVERHTRFVVLAKVDAKDSTTVVNALIKRVKRLPKHLTTSLTWDRGTELAQHARFTLATDMAVYFCDPRSPWQRGSNENTNGLLRQYLPKDADLSIYSQAKLDAIALRLNTRPRETLGFYSPAEKLNDALIG